MATLLEQIAAIKTLIEKLESLAFGDENTSATHNGQTRDSLAKAIKGKFDALQAMVQGRVSFETLSELNAFIPTADANGQYPLAEVWGDTVDVNNGLYGFDGSAWSISVFDRVDALKKHVAATVSQIFTSANVVSDPLYRYVSGLTSPFWNGDHVIEFINGVKSMTSAQPSDAAYAIRSELIDITGFKSGKLSASCVIQRKIGQQGSNDLRIRIAAFDSNGSLIGGAFAGYVGSQFSDDNYYTALVPVSDISGGEVLIIADGIDIPAGAESIEFSIRTETAITVSLSNFCLSDGINPAYRDPVEYADELLKKSESISNQITSVEDPNLMLSSASDYTELAPVVSASQYLSITEYNGQRCYKLSDTTPNSSEASVYIGSFSADSVGGVVSVGVDILHVDPADTGIWRVLLMQYDSSGSEISSARLTWPGDSSGSDGEKARFTGVALDSNCVSFRIYISVYAGSTTPRDLYFRNVFVRRGVHEDWAPSLASKTSCVWVNGDTGSDSAAGAESNPLKTVAAAIRSLSGTGTIYVQESTIEPFDFSEVNEISISAVSNARVDVFSGTQLSGFVKTSGYTNVYELTTAAVPSKTGTANASNVLYDALPWAWLHDVPEGLISASERMPQQQGREYRLPSTRLWLVADLSALDAATRPSWYHDGTKFYINISTATGSPDPLSAVVYVPGGDTCVGGAGNGSQIVRMTGINALYGEYTFRMKDLAWYELHNCSGLGSRLEGVQRDNSRGIEYSCEWAGAQNDGGNTHSTDNTHDIQSVISVFHQWTHDNADDGDSPHERCRQTYSMCLSEYNGDRGFVPANGAHGVAIGCVSRSNGQIDTNGGEGFAAVNPVQSGEGGIGTQFDCVSCLSIGDLYGFRSRASDGTVRARDCKTESAVNAAYYADSGALLELRDCGDSGSSVVKDGSGTIEIKNTSMVV